MRIPLLLVVLHPRLHISDIALILSPPPPPLASKTRREAKALGLDRCCFSQNPAAWSLLTDANRLHRMQGYGVGGRLSEPNEASSFIDKHLVGLQPSGSVMISPTYGV